MNATSFTIPSRAEEARMGMNNVFEMLGLDPIQPPPPLDDVLRFPSRVGLGPFTPAATPEDQIAREVVAQIEREDGYAGCAEHRLRGAYDGDTEHRIALAAIRLDRELRKRGERK